MSIDDVILLGWQQPRVELQCISVQRWRGSGYFPWLQLGQTANSATTATSGHLVIGCGIFILRAAGQLNNFYSTFVVLMYCFSSRGGFGESSQCNCIAGRRERKKRNHSGDISKMPGCLVFASYNASLRTHFVSANCPPTLQSWPCDVSEIKVCRVLLPLLLIPRNTLFLLVFSSHNTHIKNRGKISFNEVWHLNLAAIIILITIRTQLVSVYRLVAWIYCSLFETYCMSNKDHAAVMQ